MNLIAEQEDLYDLVCCKEGCVNIGKYVIYDSDEGLDSWDGLASCLSHIDTLIEEERKARAKTDSSSV